MQADPPILRTKDSGNKTAASDSASGSSGDTHLQTQLSGSPQSTVDRNAANLHQLSDQVGWQSR